jgi:ABC-type uncharacterized transport system ATPase subunit
MKGITKRFPGVIANDNVDFELKAGEIHGLLGENGAGKTTLMNILYGLEKPDSGQIHVFGTLQDVRSPRDALALGIGMVHQHFMLVKPFSVAANIVLGMREKTGWQLDEDKAVDLVTEFCAGMEYFKVDPEAIVEDLPVGLQQRVEILKVLFRGTKILILDEPTAVLTPQETDELFVILESLRAKGLSIIFISHKLNEVMALTHKVSVMRSGRVIGTRCTSETNESELAKMMVGRDVMLHFDKKPFCPGCPILSVRNLVVEGEQKLTSVNDISFDVKKGEILGIAGVDGNGQRELVEAIVGLRKPVSGNVNLNGKDTTGQSALAFIDSGGAYIPEDRHEVGLILDFSLSENFILETNSKPPFSKNGVLNEAKINQNAEELLKEYDIKAPSSASTARTLSGGNQQKVVVAREISREPDLLIAVNPTRGLDVGATEYVRLSLLEQRDLSRAVLLVSTELDEILAVSDRIAVMYEGRFMGEATPDTPRETIGLMMAGVSKKGGLDRSGGDAVEGTEIAL